MIAASARAVDVALNIEQCIDELSASRAIAETVAAFLPAPHN
jgi:hypothetical protein